MPEYPRHLRGFDYIGLHRYFLTFCTYERQWHFTRADHVGVTLQNILRAADAEYMAVSAYCFMPDHLHTLVTATSDATDLKAFIARSKQFSAFYFK